MEALKINNKEIQSLKELRDNFDLEQVVFQFLDGTLERWLSDYFYEELADQVETLEHTPELHIKMKLCHIIGIDYVASGFLTEAQQAVYERKRHLIHQYTNDPEVLNKALATATTQAELAELLYSGQRKIYLCGPSFHVPIRVSGVHYIGIGAPKMEAAFTEEQYRRAGISFEGIELPKTISQESIYIAEKAAAANGYDDFAEKHDALSAKLHYAMKSQKLSWYLQLSWDSGVNSDFYKSKYDAERAVKVEIDTVYDQANNYFSPGSQNCIAAPLANRYAAFLIRNCSDIIDRLTSWCSKNNAVSMRLKEMRQLVSSSMRNLQNQFEKELSYSSDYYRMYKRSYFYELIEYEPHDYNVDIFENDLLNGIARLIHDDTEYEACNMREAMSELENDVNSHANTFYCRAHEIYCDYCADIEKIAEEIGINLSDDEMELLGIKQDSCTFKHSQR